MSLALTEGRKAEPDPVLHSQSTSFVVPPGPKYLSQDRPTEVPSMLHGFAHWVTSQIVLGTSTASQPEISADDDFDTKSMHYPHITRANLNETEMVHAGTAYGISSTLFVRVFTPFPVSCC